MIETVQVPMEDASRRSNGPKHEGKAWAYIGDGDQVEHASSCSCGHTRVGLPDMETAQYVADNHWRSDFDDPTPARAEILWTSKGQEVKVTMTDQEACAALVKEAGLRSDRGRPNNFMESLAETFGDRGTWSDGQRPWAHLLANQTTKPKPEPKLSDQSFPELVEMLHTAAEHLKFPRIVVHFDEGTIKLNIAGPRARTPGSLNVTDGGRYPDAFFYGRIHQETGRFESSKNCPDWVIDTLVKFNENPAEMASLQGSRYGNCCFCGLELKTNESLEVGYGPVCAEHYGLPWG